MRVQFKWVCGAVSKKYVGDCVYHMDCVFEFVDEVCQDGCFLARHSFVQVIVAVVDLGDH